MNKGNDHGMGGWARPLGKASLPELMIFPGTVTGYKLKRP